MHTDTTLRIQEEVLNHPRNLMIEYKPDPHTYHRIHEDGSLEQYGGVTSLIQKYSPFEAQKIKFGIVNSKKPEYAHLNTVADVEAEWEEAREAGNIVHNDLENWGETGELPEYEVSQLAVDYFFNYGYTPVAFEHTIFCDELKRATPPDILLANKKGQLVVADYKTSKEIKYSHYAYNGNKKKMEYPLTHLPTSNFWGYSLQVGLEIEWLNRYYDFSFPIAPYGLIIHIRDGELQVHKTVPMFSEVRKIYKWENKLS